MKFTPPGPGLAIAQMPSSTTRPISINPITSSVLADIDTPRYVSKATATTTTIIKAVANQGQLRLQLACSSCCKMLPMYRETIPATEGAYRMNSQATSQPTRG